MKATQFTFPAMVEPPSPCSQFHKCKKTKKKVKKKKSNEVSAQKRKRTSRKSKANTKKEIQTLVNKVNKLESDLAIIKQAQNCAPGGAQTEEETTVHSELLKLLRFKQIQSKRNDIFANLFTIILHELSLKLNMKGRPKETRNENLMPLGRDKICALKLVENSCEIDKYETGDVEFAKSESLINDIAATVLEAAAISLSGQTVTSVDDKNMHRVRQIQEFKALNNIPLNGLVSLQKNVTRFNQDAGLACNMTLDCKMENGMHLCFGTEAERLAMQYLSFTNKVNNNNVYDTKQLEDSLCTECSSDIKNDDDDCVDIDFENISNLVGNCI